MPRRISSKLGSKLSSRMGSKIGSRTFLWRFLVISSWCFVWRKSWEHKTKRKGTHDQIYGVSLDSISVFVFFVLQEVFVRCLFKRWSHQQTSLEFLSKHGDCTNPQCIGFSWGIPVLNLGVLGLQSPNQLKPGDIWICLRHRYHLSNKTRSIDVDCLFFLHCMQWWVKKGHPRKGFFDFEINQWLPSGKLT